MADLVKKASMPGLPTMPDAKCHRHVCTYCFLPGDDAVIKLRCKGFVHVFIYTVVSEDPDVVACVHEGKSQEAD